MSRQSSIQALNPFEMVVDTTIAGASGVGNFQLRRNSGGYKYKVEWGDGAISAITSNSDITHTYPSGGTYTIKIRGRFDKPYYNGSIEADKILDINSWGNIVWKDMSSALEGADNLSGMTSVPPVFEQLGGNHVNQMLRACSSLNSDLGNWDMSKASNLAYMFDFATNFNNGGSPNISGWTTSSATTCLLMFGSASSFDQPIGSWDVSNVNSMKQMFQNASSFNNSGSTAISGWTVTAVTDMNSLFYGSAFNQPIGPWDVSNVIDIGSMFFSNSVFDQDVSNWDMGNVTTITSMFRDATSFNNGGSPNISGWTFNTGLTSMNSVFYEASSFDQDLSDWDVSNVTTFGGMFRGATSFNNSGSTAISGWTVSAGTYMAGMFYNADAFNQDIGNWDVSNVTKFGTLYNGMFEACALFDQDLSDWDVSNVTDFQFMFRNTGSFNNGGSPHISGWTFSTGLTSFSNMFRNADSFTQPIGEWDITGAVNKVSFLDTFRSKDFTSGPDISKLLDTAKGTHQISNFNKAFEGSNINQNLGAWDMATVTSFKQMFNNASSFNNGGSPDIADWDTSSLVNMERMFQGAGGFNQPLSGWNTSNVTNMINAFNNAGSFDQDLSMWNVSGVTSMASMFNGANNLSTENYNRILTGWTGWNGVTGTTTLQTGVSFHAGNATYSSGTTAEDAKNYLTGTTSGLSWTITDGGGS